MASPTTDLVRADLAASSLREFVALAWPVVEPGTVFKHNWHIDVICDHLQAVSEGHVRRLIVNIPPRHMKSLTTSVFWPCWEWLTRPETRWVFASYAQQLATRDSVKCRRIIESAGINVREGDRDRSLLERVGYRGLLGLLGEDRVWQLTSDQNVKTRFENDRTGYRIATSVGGSVTGEGGDRLVIDDPHKADEVQSDVMRENVIEWLDQTWSTRLNDRKTGAMVVIMQRLHEGDVTGHLLEKGGWEHVCLPAEYEPSHPFVWPEDPRGEAGELLWPDHMGAEQIAEAKTDLGSYGYAGQFQQRPAPAEGGIFKTAWWRYYPREWLEHLDEEGEPAWPQGAAMFQRVWQSWDTALKEKTANDYTVGQLWGQDGPQRFLLRQVRGRWSLVETINQVEQMQAWAAKRWPLLAGHAIYVENAAMGPELIAAVRRKLQGVVPVDVDRDKPSRAYAVTPQLEAGNVVLPGAPNAERTGPDRTLTPAWVQELIDECAAFPNASHDDQVDALTQALDPRRLQGTGRRRSSTGTRKWRQDDV